MGVRLVQVFKQDNYRDAIEKGAKPALTFNGGGGCCASLMRSSVGAAGCQNYSKGESMTIEFSDGGFDILNEDSELFFNSRMIQALCPGTRYVSDTTIFIPYKDLPGDQIATIARLAKNWFYGGYIPCANEVHKAYPNLNREDAIILGVVVGRHVQADSDSSVAFWSPTVGEAIDYILSGGYQNWSVNQGPAHYEGPDCSHVLRLLKGEVTKGQQHSWKKHSYFKAGFVPQYLFNTPDYRNPIKLADEWVFKERVKQLTHTFGGESYCSSMLDFLYKIKEDRSLFHTVNAPVCGHKDGSPVITRSIMGIKERVKFFMDWVESEGKTWGDRPAKKEEASPEATIDSAIVLPRIEPVSEEQPKKRSSATKASSSASSSSSARSRASSASSKSATSSSAPTVKKPRVKKTTEQTIH